MMQAQPTVGLDLSDAIQLALEALTAADLQTPGSAVTASDISWLQIWRLAERARLRGPPFAPTRLHLLIHQTQEAHL
jgi:hypothetical protein